MKLIHIIIGIIFSLVLVSACKSMPTQNSENLNIYNKNDDLVISLDDTKIISSVQRALENRKKTYVKILPQYEYYIDLPLEGKKQKWLVTASGYIADKKEPGQLYKVELPEAFKSILLRK